ncbi:MAG: nuclease-related domain-containing protein [Chloroflexota bacterium]|nr:nuclease-related domain-containing protein [Chloroflexota bacterium]
MRVVRNERRIHVSSSIGQYATLAGLLALVAGLVISFVRPEWFVLMLVSLVLGFSLSVVGGFLSDRFVGPLAHHDALAGALKGLDDQYTLLQYTLPASHVLLGPGGCTAFVVKAQGGQVTYQEDGRWKHRQKGKLFRQFAGQEAVGAPNFEAERQVQKLGRWLACNLPDVEVPVRPVIVFVNPDVTLDADGSPVPTFYGKKVKAWLRGPGKRKLLPADVHRQLTEALGIQGD